MSSTSRIYDSGYRRYDGPRLGPGYATRSLVFHTLQRIFGLRRPARYKVLPFLISLIAFVPPAVFVGLAAFLPDQLADETLPSYGDIYGYISAVVVLFAMFVAPEALCSDRRSGVLSLYLAAPLTRARYLAAKAAAVGSALLVVTTGPPLLLLIGLSLQNEGPNGPGDLVVALVRILAAGVMISAFYTALSLAVSSLTDRRAVAAAGTFIFVQATGAVSSVLVEALDAPNWLYGLSLGGLPFQLGRQIHGEPTTGDEFNVTVTTAVIAAALWTAAAAFVAWRRYQKLQVTR